MGNESLTTGRAAVPHANNQTLRFGTFEVDLRAGELRKAGVKIKLHAQPFEVLVMLLERPGEVVSREEIQQNLWASDTFVDFEHGLNKTINKVREALGDDADNPRYIETLPRRGYRFIGPIAEPSPAALPEKTKDEPSRRKFWLVALAAAVIAGLMIAGFVWSRTPPPSPRVLRYTQLTTDGLPKADTCLEGYSLLSTNGTRVFFAERDSLVMQVPATGGEAVRVPTPFGCFVFWGISPDTDELIGATAGGVDAPLWVLSTVTGLARRVGDLSGHAAAWSPDGQSIAYATGPWRDHQFGEVYIARKDGNGSRRIARIENVYIYNVSWSPNGKLIRMEVSYTDKYAVWEVHSDGTNLHRLAVPSGGFYGVWTADQKYFLFGWGTKERVSAIWAVREKPWLFRKNTAKPVQLTSSAMNFWAPVVSPDGKRIFAIGGLTRGQLLRYDMKLQRYEPYLSGISAVHLDFSRDGQWVTYVTFPDGVLWRSKVDGSERMQLTALPMSAGLPRWSPDGKQIAFVGQSPKEFSKIYVVSAAGGQPQLVSQGDEAQVDPSWAADGHSLIFSLSFYSARPRLYSVDLRTGQASVIPGSEGMYRPHVSPDGRFIVAVETPGNQKLFLFDQQTQKWFELARLSQRSPTPLRWSADSKYLYFVINSVPQQPLYRVHIPDGKLERLAVLDVPGGITGIWQIGVSLAPDGSPVVLGDKSLWEVYALDVDLP